jgi:hypothetical protein
MAKKPAITRKNDGNCHLLAAGALTIIPTKMKEELDSHSNAADLGAVSETFSRTLAKLREQKLLAVKGKTIIIPSPAKLRALLQRNLGE